MRRSTKMTYGSRSTEVNKDRYRKKRYSRRFGEDSLFRKHRDNRNTMKMHKHSETWNGIRSTDPWPGQSLFLNVDASHSSCCGRENCFNASAVETRCLVGLLAAIFTTVFFKKTLMDLTSGNRDHVGASVILSNNIRTANLLRGEHQNGPSSHWISASVLHDLSICPFFMAL